MKNRIIAMFLLIALTGVVGCGSTETTKEESQDVTEDNTNAETNDDVVNTEDMTLGNKLAELFMEKEPETTDMEGLANELAEVSEMDCIVVEANEGYLNGFSEEITGFKSGTQFSPVIGSIAFVGYIFETDNPEELKENLLSKADPRWNICTEAQETVCVISGNHVFFTMCPGDEE